MRPARRPVHLAAALLLAAAAACGGDAGTASGGPAPIGSADSERVEGDVVVFAAASLTGTFTELAEQFEAAHPGVTVTLNLGASSALAQSILSGAPADVFAAASPATMRTVTDAGEAARAEVFVRNTLEIAVPAGNPEAVTGLADFADDALTVALCAEQVPCGAAAQEVFAATGIEPAPDTLEQDVKAALSKVTLGEVDAALVYRTDVLAAGDDVEGIAFPEADRAVNDYLLAVLTGAPNPGAAAAFADLVRSDDGQRVLVSAGFERP